MKFWKSNIGVQLAITIIGAILFIPFLGQVHLFDWDEINFAESAREMIVSGNYITVQINFEPFWEKPPFFIWMQVLSMKIFGINEFAARFPNAICGILTLLALFNIGKTTYNKKFGLLWVFVYGGSILPFFYFKSGIIDPWFNLFIFLGIYYIFKYFQTPSIKSSVLSALFIGFSILTKGPVGLLIFGLSAFIYLIIKQFNIVVRWKDIGTHLVVLILVGGFWFLLQIFDGNYSILVDFIKYQIHLFSKEGAGHGGFLLYHFVILFFGVFPSSIFVLKSFKRNYNNSFPEQMRLMMVVLFWTVLILFTIANTKIVHYSSMCYFPLTFLATYVMYQIIEKKILPSTWISYLIGIVGGFFVLIVAAFPWVGINAKKIIATNLIKDEFAKANMQANVNWSGWMSLIAVVLLITLIIYLIYWRKKAFAKSFYVLYGGTALFLFLSITIITPKIENYSQRAAIEFYKSLVGKNCYVKPLGFKSYAHYFYSQKTPKLSKNISENWLLNGKIDKKAWFVIRTNRFEQYKNKYPQLIKYNEHNGFVFCYREPTKNKSK